MLSATAVGRLVRDAETRTTAGGHVVCKFTVATDHGFGEKKITTFVACDVWGKTAEWAGANLKKGDRVAVSGKGYLRKWEKDGKSGAEFTVDANDVENLWDRKEDGGGERSQGGGRSGGGSYGGGRAQADEAPPYAPDEGIPF
jgi:single-strand DNA-binding protein